MKTNNILKALAFALLITTACNKSEIANDENTEKKGFALPVTVNVTRQGGDPATKATYTDNGDGTGSLGFSAGDKLFVQGTEFAFYPVVGQFAGTLTWVSGNSFSGTIVTEIEYPGTFEELLTYVSSNGIVTATLLPAGYESYDYLEIIEDVNEYENLLGESANNSFATSKQLAVEQLSYETGSFTSGTGFVLEPQNAILNFTITGLTASTEVTATLTDGSPLFNIEGDVTTDGSGNATFAMGVLGTMDLNGLSLTVAGNPVTLVNSSTELAAGKIYNITRSAAPALTYPIALGDATSDYVGSVVTTDGNVYATVAAASAASKTAVAVIAYVGSAGSVDASSASYKGLAIAMSDAGADWCQWCPDGYSVTCVSQYNNIAVAIGYKDGISNTNTLTSDGHTHAAATAAASNNGTAAPTGTSGWFLPSIGQWNLIVQGLASKKAGSAVTTDITTSDNNTYAASNLNSVITDAGGTGFKSSDYHSSTLRSDSYNWVMKFGPGRATDYRVDNNNYVRSVIAF